METLFKKDVATLYAQKAGISKAEAERRIDDVLGVISDALADNKNVKLNNFFNFFVKERAEKEGINPITKKPMIIPATKTIHAKMTKPLKDRIQYKK